jgi:hypothetical protein
MDSGKRFRINAPKVIFEAFDDEVVLINLDNGNYYSLNNEGIAVWSLIGQGATGREIVAALAARHHGSETAIAEAIREFLAQLQTEELILPTQGPDGHGNHTFTLPGTPESSDGSFVAPTLSRYTDMQELLLLDPIHDVDETGWPAANR